MREPGLLSVVAPMHDEEDTVRAFHARTVAALDGLDYELILVDDGSRDGTGEQLRALAAADERTKVVALSRSFGHQAAISAGLEHARDRRPSLPPSSARGRTRPEPSLGVREAG